MPSNGNNATVWVVNNGGHNYQAAEQFGELKDLTYGRINPLIVDRLAQDLSRSIGNIVEEEDYLLISGAHILNMLALVFWLRRFGTCRVLQWNAKNRDYELSMLDSSHLDKLLDSAIVGI